MVEDLEAQVEAAETKPPDSSKSPEGKPDGSPDAGDEPPDVVAAGADGTPTPKERGGGRQKPTRG